jgi:hypothetical protein
LVQDVFLMQAGVALRLRLPALLSRRGALRAALPPAPLRRARHAQRALSTRATAGATYLKELRI